MQDWSLLGSNIVQHQEYSSYTKSVLKSADVCNRGIMKGTPRKLSDSAIKNHLKTRFDHQMQHLILN